MLAACLVAGMTFIPVFGASALLLPVAAVCVAVFGAVELCRRRRGLLALRPVLLVAAGLLAVVETVLIGSTVAGLPTAETLRLLVGSVDSWRFTLQSTWPALADPELVVFVPLLVLTAAVLGIELLDRVGPPLVALLPSLALIGLGQAYQAFSGSAATVTALLYALAAAGLLVPRRVPASSRSVESSRLRMAVVFAPLVVAGVLGAILLGALDPAGRPPYSLQRDLSAPLPTSRVSSPLSEIGQRLGKPGTEVFRYRSDSQVDRWRLVVLEDFDGVNWTTDAPFRRIGRGLAPGSAVTVPVRTERASVEIGNLGGPWLPSQLWPSGVDGVSPLVDPASGVLLLGDADASARYSLKWSTPVTDLDGLLEADVDQAASDGLGDLGTVPPEVSELAAKAIDGHRPSFRTALALESFLGQNYRLVRSGALPTGHSWPQLTHFLLDNPQGTSEQFAAAYVALARINGIPARLAVGFRSPGRPGANGWYSVRDGDVLAWPEVALEGIGWWPLDPAGQADTIRANPIGQTATVTEQARKRLPVEEPQGPGLDEPAPLPESADPGWSRVWVGLQLMLLVPLAGLCWLAGVPLVKKLRRRRRRRRPPRAAVVGAWAESRDLLRAHGVRHKAGMTVRDLAAAACALGRTDRQSIDQVVTGLTRLGVAVDAALWSGASPNDRLAEQAWRAVRQIRAGLRRRPVVDRFRAMMEVRTLLPPPKQVNPGRWRPGSAWPGSRTAAGHRSPAPGSSS